jgi:perosamine synthetase
MKPRIYFSKPSITELDVRYATDAAQNSWGDLSSDYINRFEEALKPIWASSFPSRHQFVLAHLNIGMAALDSKFVTIKPKLDIA